MTYAIAVGVRRNESQLRDRINAILVSRMHRIEAILHAFGVPELPITSSPAVSRR
jgi:hypothetical protein